MNSIEIKIFYRKLLKTAKSIQNYNFQDFFVRKLKNDFRHKNLNKEDVQNRLEELKRIAVVQNLYHFK